MKFKPLYLIFPLLGIVGALYLVTAAPFMLWLDSLDFISASLTLGINNPPAPFFVFLAHIFTLLPFGSVIFKIQMFSALSAIATLFLVYQLIIWIINRIEVKFNTLSLILAGLFGIFSLAFSYQFWSQAQNTEMFILICLLEILSLYLIITSSEEKVLQKILLISFVLGLSLGTNPVVLSFFPSIALGIWIKRKFLTWKKVFLAGLVFVFGVILIYSYLPLMASRHPFLNYGNPTTLGAIWRISTGQGLNVNSSSAGVVNGFTGSPGVFLSSSRHYLEMIWLSFTPLILPFTILGIWWLWNKGKDLFWILSLVLISNFILSGLYLSANQESWYLLSDVALAIFSGVGFFWITSRINGKRWVVLLIFLISFSPLIYWWNSLYRHDDRLTGDYLSNLYTPIRPPAILLGDSDLFVGASYFAYSTDFKNGVVPVFDGEFWTSKTYRQNLQKNVSISIPEDSSFDLGNPDDYSKFINDFFSLNLPKYRIYLDYPVLSTRFIPRDDDSPTFKLNKSKFRLVPAGLVEEVVPKNSSEKVNTSNFAFQFSNGFPNSKPTLLEKSYNLQLGQMLSEYSAAYNSLGDFYLSSGINSQAVSFYQRAYSMDSQNTDVLNNLGLYYGQHNQGDLALFYFQKEHEIKPNDVHVLYNLALAEGLVGNVEQEKILLNQVLSLASNNPDVMQEATKTLSNLGVQVPKSEQWETFEDEKMNLTFKYPEGFEVRNLNSEIGLFKNNQPILYIFSASTTSGESLDKFVQKLSIPIKGKITQSKQATVQGFDEGIMELYTFGQDNTELLLLKKGNQNFAITILLNSNTNNDQFAQELMQIIQSINSS